MTAASQRCPVCGKPLPGEVSFCPSCGHATPTSFVAAQGEPERPAPLPVENTTAERLAAVLGGDYVLGDLLGRGGFAEVYSAFDRRLKRQVAVKVLREELRGDAALRERFRREAETVAQLRHPHVVQIYSVGEEQGLAYFVMPLLEGETLAAALEHESRWTFPEVCRILREAASALAEAHRSGLVHRDVKPENIYLDGPNRRVVIMDFGIAKAVDEQATHLTATGMLVGSPQYMSPEQAAGDRVDAQTDQYSLALVGYRMLSGRLPFEADSVRSLLFKQATEPPPAIEQLRPDIPATLGAIVMRALSKERGERFATMSEFEAGLTRVAAEVAGDFRRRRTMAPLAERWTTALSEVYDRPWRWVVALAAGLLLFLYAYPRGESRGAREALAARDTAVAAADAELRAVGIDAPREGTYSGASSNFYRYLQEALGPRAADSAAVSLGLWTWQLSRYRREPYEWSAASADPRGRLTYLFASVADSVARPSLSPDSALHLALAYARRLGYDSATLGPARRTDRPLVARRDYWFTWNPPSAIPKRGRDSVAVTFEVGIAGDRVQHAYLSRSLPKPSGLTLDTPGGGLFVSLTGIAIAVLLFGSLAVAAKRAAFDAIQWGATFRLGVMFLVVHTVAAIVPKLPGMSTPLFSARNVESVADTLMQGWSGLEFFAPGLFVLVMLAAAESLLNESRPELMAGLTDVSLLRLRTPEMLRVLPAGVALGALFAGLRAAAVMGGRLGLHLVIDPNTAVPRVALLSAWPTLGVLGDVGMSAMTLPTITLLVAAAIRWRRPWLAPVLAAVMSAAMYVMFRNTSVPWWQAVLGGLVGGALAVVILYRGLLAGGVVLFVATGLPIAYDLFWAGGPFLGAGVEALVLLLLPVVLFGLTYRQRPTMPAAAAPRRSAALEGGTGAR